MAFLEFNFFSDVLGMAMSMNVVLPQRTRGNIGVNPGEAGETFPTLWLLHGMSDDHTIWMRRTSIERYAEEHGIAVVMPTTYLGW
ncbi:MAG: esterase family protein, partial [Clostridia bacterium]|nr:esterase family protein [Clostridia bacterium]